MCNKLINKRVVRFGRSIRQHGEKCHTLSWTLMGMCVYFESVWGAHHGGGEINFSWRCHLRSGQHWEIGVCPSHTTEDPVNNLESDCRSSCPLPVEQERSVCVYRCRCGCQGWSTNRSNPLDQTSKGRVIIAPSVHFKFKNEFAWLICVKSKG